MKSVKKQGKVDPMSARMRRLRTVYEGDDYGAMSRFAARIEVGVPRWHNVENGRPVGFALADILVRTFPGLTLDWIYYGKLEGLTVSMARALEKEGDGPATESTTGAAG